MDKKEMQQIWEQVKENRKKLDSCPKHNFDTEVDPTKKYNTRYRCSNCGGELGASEVSWYEKGLEHAGGAK